MNDMIYRILVGFFCFFSLVTEAQVLRDLNFNHIYPNAVFSFDWKVIKEGNNFKVYYEGRQQETGRKLSFSITLETRGSLTEKSGNPISSPPITNQSENFSGTVEFQAEAGQAILVAKVTITGNEKELVYTFYKLLPKDNSLYLQSNQPIQLRPYVNTNNAVTFSGFDSNRPLEISYYKTSFPPAAPAFSNTQTKVSKTLKPDSIFKADPKTPVAFYSKGLYLAQQDTATAVGIAFRAETDYPKLSTIEGLAGPLIYICTKQEADKLKQVGNDKKKFDQLILSITGNAERARTFMRSYFKRVELANQYFSSYKEGWKTDRGMIYIIFGLPEEVYLFEDREVWEYKNNNAKIRFQFTRSPSLFDPDNYVLVRDKKFTTPWYEMIDLWRKARF